VIAILSIYERMVGWLGRRPRVTISAAGGETLMGRWKTVIGPKLKARSFENQKTGARISVGILDRMTEIGRPNFERTA
jgi:hypothetical protein